MTPCIKCHPASTPPDASFLLPRQSSPYRWLSQSVASSGEPHRRRRSFIVHVPLLSISSLFIFKPADIHCFLSSSPESCPDEGGCWFRLCSTRYLSNFCKFSLPPSYSSTSPTVAQFINLAEVGSSSSSTSTLCHHLPLWPLTWTGNTENYDAICRGKRLIPPFLVPTRSQIGLSFGCGCALMRTKDI